MSTVPYARTSSCCCRRHSRSGCRRTIWPISSPTDQMDLSEITGATRSSGAVHHPRMMVKVLLYGYCNGVASSRRIARRLHEDIAFL